MVEVTPTLLKKPFFQSHKSFIKSLLLLPSRNAWRDAKGNTVAHLCVFCGEEKYLSELSPLLEIKNKDGLTPQELLKILSPDSSPHAELHVYRSQEGRIGVLSRRDVENSFQVSLLDHLSFSRPQDLLWVLKRCEKKLENPAIRRRGKWIESLHGRAFLNKKYPLMYLKWINPLVGYGLFAGEDIPPYSFIGEYTGVVRKRNTKLDRYNHYIFGYVTAEATTPFVIDAKHYGNHTRFMNHSDEPNLYSTWLITQNICHIIFVTREAIKKETQLTYDYGEVYWKKRSDPLQI